MTKPYSITTVLFGTILLRVLCFFWNQQDVITTAYAFLSSSTLLSFGPPAGRSKVFFATTTSLFAGELGELTVSEPSPLDPILLDAAKEVLPWEKQEQQDADDNGNSVVYDDNDDCDHWKQGQVWHQTRIKLTNLWVLPRDMSNGAWDAYGVAASTGEQKILKKVPQLLRIDTEKVVKSAKTVLTTLSLPPSLLRKEPILLTLDPTCLVGGFETLLLENNNNNNNLLDEEMDDNNNNNNVSVLEACRDTPGLLFDAAIEWKNKKNLKP